MLLYSGFLLNALSVKKAGVMRHIYTKKTVYMQGIYSPDSLFIQQIIITVLGILILWETANIISKKKSFKDDNKSVRGTSRFYVFQLIIAVLLSVAVIIVMKAPAFIAMMSYPYIIMGFQIALGIQILIVIYLKYFSGFYPSNADAVYMNRQS